MMPPERPLIPTSLPYLHAMLTDDGSRTLRDDRIDETYHSGCGALSECLYVYLRNSGIERRMLEQRQNGSDKPLRILEIGFGTGMAWLLTCSLAHACRVPLTYISLENQLLPDDVLAQLHIGAAAMAAIESGWLLPEYAAIAKIEIDWLAAYRSKAWQLSGRCRIWSCEPSNQLEIILGDARESLTGEGQLQLPFDAVYFDAFSPTTSPELWTTSMFQQLKDRLHPQGQLVSYCVKGEVRRALENVGFTVARLPGPPGGKREVLVARPADLPA